MLLNNALLIMQDHEVQLPIALYAGMDLIHHGPHAKASGHTLIFAVIRCTVCAARMQFLECLQNRHILAGGALKMFLFFFLIYLYVLFFVIYLQNFIAITLLGGSIATQSLVLKG